MKILIILLCSLSSTLLPAQSEKFVHSELPYTTISNINGYIHVIGEDRNDISVELLNVESEDDVSLVREEYEDGLYIYVQLPGHQITINAKDHTISQQWDSNRGSVKIGSFHYDLLLRVPKHTNLNLSTLNDGEIDVKNITGELSVNNLNHSINLSQVSQLVYANALNGDIDVDFTSNPVKEMYIHSLNGGVTLNMPDELHADLSFSSFNGELYTNVDDIRSTGPKIKKNTSDEGFEIKIGKENNYVVGNGGPKITIETFNGDAYLKENN